MFPKKVDGNLYVSGLFQANFVFFPEVLKGSIFAESLTYATDVDLPKVCHGSIAFDRLEKVDHLEFPMMMVGSVILQNLHSFESVKLPLVIGGDLLLNAMTNTNHLDFPHTVKNNLFLNSLESLNGETTSYCWNCFYPFKTLEGKVPAKKGDLYLNSLKDIDQSLLPKDFKGLVFLQDGGHPLRFEEILNSNVEIVAPDVEAVDSH